MITIPKIKAVTLAALRRIKLVRPKKARSYWQGIPHAQLVDAIMKKCKERGWEVANCRFTTSKSGSELAGVFDVVIKDLKAPKGIQFQLGLLTSNNLRRALRLVAGAQVMVCHNGMTRGEIVLRHRLTKEFDLDGSLEQGLTDYQASIKELGGEIESMKAHTFNDDDVAHLLLGAAKMGIVPWSRLGKVVKEFEVPSYDYGCLRSSAWSLMNAFTVVIKENPPLNQMQHIEQVRQIVLARMRQKSA